MNLIIRSDVKGSLEAIEKELGKFEHPEDAEIDPIEYGGIGVEWRFESLGWIGNFQHRKL